MAKRIKKVFSNGDQVMHLWANQSQSDARSSNVFFEGTKIYSYGYHYLLGELHEINGIKIALINSRRYSVTTSKHQSWIKSAVSHMPALSVVDPSNTSFDVIEAAMLQRQGELVDDLMDYFNKRRFWSSEKGLSSWIKDEITEFNNNCNILGFKHLRIEVTEDFIKLMQDHTTLMQRREVELKSPEYVAKREATKLKKLQNIITMWRQGGPLQGAMRSINPVLIRVNGDTVQTSKGASVPLNEAKALLSKILDDKVKSGEKIGSFTFNKVNNGLVTIGCHIIALDEARKVLGIN